MSTKFGVSSIKIQRKPRKTEICLLNNGAEIYCDFHKRVITGPKGSNRYAISCLISFDTGVYEIAIVPASEIKKIETF